VLFGRIEGLHIRGVGVFCSDGWAYRWLCCPKDSEGDKEAKKFMQRVSKLD